MSDESKRNSETCYWAHEEDPDKRAEAVQVSIDAIMRDQAFVREQSIKHLRMYRNMAMAGIGPNTYSRPDRGLGGPLSLNIVRSMCNTVHNHIGKSTPRPACKTSGASWEKVDEYKKVERWVAGMFKKEGVYRTGKRCLLDMIVLGSYALKVVPQTKPKSIVFDRVFPLELLVDTAEGMHGEPRSMHQVKYIDRRVAMKKYPDAETAIREASLNEAGGEFEYLDMMRPDTAASDMVRLVESYYEASDPDADDGIRTVSICGKHIYSEKYRKKLSATFKVGRWSWAPLGFWGMGLAEELAGIQEELNRLMRKVQMAMGLFGAPYVMIDRASNVLPGQVTNVPGTILLYTGKEPKVVAVQTVHPEVFQQIDRLYQRGFEIAGVNQFQAFGAKPGGIESGRAMVAYNDTGNDRLANAFEEYQDLYVAAAEMGIDAADEIPNYKVRVYGSDDETELDFKKDIDLERDEFVLEVSPVSKLSDSLTAQMDFADRLINMGLGGKPDDILEKFAWSPDMVGWLRAALAPKRMIQKMISEMMKEPGRQFVCEPHMNAALALDEAQKAYALAFMADKPNENGMKRLRNFMMSCTDMIKAAQTPGAPAGAGAPNGGPPAVSPQGNGSSGSDVAATMMQG